MPKSTSAVKVKKASVTRKARTSDQAEAAIREWLGKISKIKVTWECGGDEAILQIHRDGKPLKWDDSISLELSNRIIEILELPSAGEIYNDGGGDIKLQGSNVVLAYNATELGMEYDHETEEVTELPPKKINGTINLFEKL